MAVKWSCSFCGHDQDDVDRLIAGPRVFICDKCVRSCAENFSGGIPATAPFLENRPRYSTNNVHGPDALCSFCGKRWDDVQWVVKGPHEELICAECVWLTIQIINEAPPSGPTVRVRAHDRSWRAWLHWPWPTRHMDKATRL